MIRNGSKVKIHYTLTVDGQVIDTSRETEPLEYLHGSGQIIPGLERALLGLSVGDSKQIDVGPEDAYGVVDQEAIIEINRQDIGDQELEEGMVIAGKNSNGETVRGLILAVNFDTVTVDFNHPLAGKELHFDIEIIGIGD